MSAPSPPVVGRLAPSPTGRLHVGHARSFLVAWWSARAAGGEIVLRIEDLDRTRCKPEWEAGVLEDLEWLGLDWDGTPLRQSDDLEPYHAAAERLLARGLAYPCVCSRREIEAHLAAPHAGGELVYPGTCRGRFADVHAAERQSGRPAGVRFRVAPGPHAIEDRVHGRFTADPSAECGDFLLLRRDGMVAYQLAVVVDDARQGVTEVVRGDDLLPSAVRQHLLREALGLPHPAWAHVPLVHMPDGRRLAKRGGAVSLSDLREGGADPREIVAWCARTLGLADRSEARLWPNEVVGRFAWPAIEPGRTTWDPPA